MPEFFLHIDQGAEQGSRAAARHHGEHAAGVDTPADASAKCSEAVR